MTRPTIRDVATRAGVAHQTVARVINGDRGVKGATRDHVLAAIGEFDDVPNAVARSLSSARTHTFGVVMADVADYAFGQTVAGAEAEARRRGFYLVIGSVEDAADEAERGAYLQILLQRRVEGLILDWPTLATEGGPGLAAAARVPVVLVAATADLPGIQTVDFDNRRAGRDAAALLIEHGDRTMATITGPPRQSAAKGRLDGYRDALRTAGLTELPSLVQRCPDWGPSSGRAAAARLLDADTGFTSIFAQSDLLAAGALAELRGRGLRVPKHVSVVGFDELPIASYLEPALTTMRQPIRELGAHAVSILTDGIGRRGADPDDQQRRHLLSAHIIVRGSVTRPTEEVAR